MTNLKLKKGGDWVISPCSGGFESHPQTFQILKQKWRGRYKLQFGNGNSQATNITAVTLSRIHLCAEGREGLML